jgi:hypothetical protein
MKNASENLWAKDFTINKINTPIAILKEQAKYLKEMTKGILVGDVISHLARQLSGLSEKEVIQVFFSIKAPFMDNYKVSIIKIEQHPINIYPLKVVNLIPDEEEFSETSFEFMDEYSEYSFNAHIKSILRSKRMSIIIGNLISQSEVAA